MAMTLQEAVNSGNRWKRQLWQTWYRTDGIYIRRDSDGQPLPSGFFTRDDINATDYIIEEKTVTVTKKQVIDAAHAAERSYTQGFFAAQQHYVPYGQAYTSLSDCLLKELGL